MPSRCTRRSRIPSNVIDSNESGQTATVYIQISVHYIDRMRLRRVHRDGITLDCALRDDLRTALE